ncbi:MAG: polysaccharide biosynthesis/export family protein [bacterium]
MKVLRRFAVFVLVAGLTFPSLRAEEPPKEESTFRPGDKVQVMVWRQEEITGEYQIGVNGAVKMPLIGSVLASGLTVDAFTDTLVACYSAFIKKPMITVIPMFRVTILGAVRIPGSYWVSGSETVTDLIAMAGGLAEKAVMEKTKITRDGEVLVVNAAQFARSGKTLGDIGIQSGDIVVVPKSRWPNWTEWAVILSTIALGWSLYNSIKK